MKTAFQQTMCSGTISYSNGLCDKCGMPAISTSNKCIRMFELGSQPEPEESQTELFSLVYRIMDQGGRPEDRFTIKRKKQ